ncbi:MAG TPA: hypothetical protein VGK67_41385 [Myxococcales bacterium]
MELVIESEEKFDELFECGQQAGSSDAGISADGGAASASGIDFAAERLVIVCKGWNAIRWAVNHDGKVNIGVSNPAQCGGARDTDSSFVLVPVTDSGLELFECPQGQCVCDSPFGCSPAP